MDEPIHVRFLWTADELLEARRFHWRHSCRPVFRWAGHFIAVLAILAGYGYYCSKGISWGAVLLPLAGIYWLFLRRFDARWTVRRQFAKRPDRNMEVDWAISGEKLESRTEASKYETTWKMITKVVRTPKGILLYPHSGLFYWLPRHGFHDDGDFQRLAELAKSKVSAFHVVA